MSATLADLVEEVVGNLYGFSNAYDQMAGLVAGIGPTDRILSLDSVDGVSKGVIQIDGELIWVDTVDRATGTVRIPAYGRGFRGTQPAQHLAGALVTVSPTWPAATVVREINNVISGMYPQLFAVEHLDYQLGNLPEVHLPFEAERVLGVRVQDRSGAWVPFRAWDYLRESDRTVIQLLDLTFPSLWVRVLYGTSPAALVSMTQPFTASGLPESCRDVVTLGVQSRLLPYLDAARLPVISAEADELGQSRPVGAALQLSQELKKTYQSRLLVEAGKLQDRYPVQIRRTR